MAVKLGMNCKLYYKAGGIGGGGAWTLANNVKDVTLNLEKGEADATTRGNNGWEAVVAVLKKAAVEFSMVWDPADAAFAAFKDAFVNDTVIGIRVLDGEFGLGGQGLEADMDVMKFARNEPLTEAANVDIAIKPTYSTTAPTWIGP